MDERADDRREREPHVVVGVGILEQVAGHGEPDDVADETERVVHRVPSMMSPMAPPTPIETVGVPHGTKYMNA